MKLKSLWKWYADGPKTWADFVVLADLKEKADGTVPPEVRAKAEVSWLETLGQSDRLSSIASILERLYTEDDALQRIASLLRNKPRKTPVIPTAGRYSKSVDSLMEEENITRTEALEKLATYLNEQPGGAKTKTAESLRVEISKWKNSNND